MNKKLKSKLLTLILSGTVIFTAAGCDSNTAKKDSGSSNNTIASADKVQGKKEAEVIKLEGGDWGAPNPYKHYQRGPGSFKMRLVFDGLIEKDEKGIIPWLAESWEVNNEGKEYIFKIRNGVKWQDGKELTPEDVKFSFEYFEKNPPVSYSLGGRKGKEKGKGINIIKSIDIIEGDSVKILVNKPNVTLLEKLGDVRIIPKHIWENVKDPKNFNDKEAFIGCGPYICEEYNKEAGSYKFKAFKDYWRGEAVVKEIQFVPVSDPVLAFEKGDIDMFSPSADVVKRYENKKEYKMFKAPAFWGYKLSLNMEKCPELKEKEVRQAMGYSIDKKELIQKVARGAAVPASAGYLPQDHIWYNKNVKNYDFNTNKAKELLKDKKLSFELLIGNSKPEIRIAELMKISMEKSGIELKVKSVDGKTRDAAVKKGDYQLCLIGYGGWGSDADQLRGMFASGKTTTFSGIPGYSNKEVNELCEKQAVQFDEKERKETVFKLQELISEEVPVIPIYNTTGYTVYKPEKYNGWMCTFDHHCLSHCKLSYLK